jgi:hypothetical protein
MRSMVPMTLDDAAAAPFRVTVATQLDAEPHAVFAELGDPSLWFPMMRRSVWRTGATSGVGAEREVDIVGFGKFRERMLVWEPGVRLAFTMTATTSPLILGMCEDWRMTRVDGRTRVEVKVSGYPSTIGRIAKPLLRRVVATVFSGAARSLGKRASQYPRGKQAV